MAFYVQHVDSLALIGCSCLHPHVFIAQLQLFLFIRKMPALMINEESMFACLLLGDIPFPQEEGSPEPNHAQDGQFL
jgi:hypothetical protein